MHLLQVLKYCLVKSGFIQILNSPLISVLRNKLVLSNVDDSSLLIETIFHDIMLKLVVTGCFANSSVNYKPYSFILPFEVVETSAYICVVF